MTERIKAKKILIARFSSLGDILLTTPVVRALRYKYPQAQIDFLLNDEYKQVYEFNPYVNNLLLRRKNINENDLVKKIKAENYDLIVDLQNSFRSRKLLKNTGVMRKVFKKPTLNKFLLVKFKINRFKEIIPIPVYYAGAFGNLELDGKGLDLFLPEDLKADLKGKEKYIGLCPGSRHFTKMWPVEYFIELGKMLTGKGFTVVLFGGKDDKKITDEISVNIKGAVNLCNDNNLFATAVNMKKCELVVCNDSGLMHTASAVGTPLIAIFGSTVKEFGFAPYKAESLILENNLLNCRPCSHIGRSNCPEKHFKCMLEITPHTVYNNILRFLSR